MPRRRRSAGIKSRARWPSTAAVEATDGEVTAQAGNRTRVLALALIATICVLIPGAYVAVAAMRDGSDGLRGTSEPLADGARLAAMAEQPHLVMLETDGDTYRRVALAPLDGGEGERLITPLECQRVHFAAGRGLCLGADPWSGGAFTFNAAFDVVHRLEIAGLPSRARVSPDGRLGAMTVFVTGHSYAEGGFSTSTVVIDMESGRQILELEELRVTRDGAVIDAADLNFWGVTFAADSNQFYATLATGGRTYLIEGDVNARSANVLHENVECPSLSPDGTRIAFKKRIEEGLGVRWRLTVLDLETMQERPLGELRNVDDQVEWLDDEYLIYSLPDLGPPASIRPDLWLLPLDGDPELVTTRAMSPAAVNPNR